MCRVMLVLLLLPPAVASATIDASGPWQVGGFYIGGRWNFIQSGTSLVVEVPSHAPLNGSIDSVTGAFTLGGVGICPPTADSVTGTISADNTSLTAVETIYIPHCTVTCTCDGLPENVVGARLVESCGNGQLDPGEDCDDGNVADGDCCSAQCRFAAAGSGCTSDGNVCTDDVCDAAGACQHVPNTAPCEEACLTGTRCDGGQCIGGTPFPSGTACDADGNACTEDACDDAGHCVPTGAVLDCQPCGLCSPTAGCVGTPDPTCVASNDPHAGLAARLQRGKHADSVGWTWIDSSLGTELGDFGDPLTTDSYTLCIYDGWEPAPPQRRVLAQARVAAGGTCGRRACWKPTGTGFRYSQGSSPGIRSLKIDAREGHPARIKLRGVGLGLSTMPPLIFPPVDVQLLRAGGACWGVTYPGLGIVPSDRIRVRP